MTFLGKTILVTGCAGFIGAAVSRRLLAQGARVLGIDSLNAYYSIALKQSRLTALQQSPDFSFHQQDLSDHSASISLIRAISPDIIIHLAAQAGVRASAEVPFDYVASNLIGHMSVLEAARQLPALEQLIYASSSSVYGNRLTGKFREDDRVDDPTSLYAATKRADELMSQVYSASFGTPMTGLRFFTVYGPAGRPDMAYFSFAEQIHQGLPITVYDEGALERDFTYIDDIVSGVLAVATNPLHPSQHRIYNIGNDQPQTVLALVGALESALETKAIVDFQPKPRYDVVMTAANIDAMRRDFGWAPSTDLVTGIGHFGAWFRDWKQRGN